MGFFLIKSPIENLDFKIPKSKTVIRFLKTQIENPIQSSNRNRAKESESRRNRERVSELLEKMNFEVCCGVVWPEKKQRGGVGVERDDGTGRDF